MPTPKNFSAMNAGNENFIIDPNNVNDVILFRFGDRNKPGNWASTRRSAAAGNFARPSNTDLNDWAIKQSSYGSSSENNADNPYLSVVTSYADLFAHGEGWVQNILRAVPDLARFSVPFARVFRPSPTKLISKQETEWLYYDGDATLLSCLTGWQVNPYLAPVQVHL
jgi:hypothetical protein